MFLTCSGQSKLSTVILKIKKHAGKFKIVKMYEDLNFPLEKSLIKKKYFKNIVENFD